MPRTQSPPSPLDDPDTARHAWARYRRLMRVMVIVTGLCVALSMLALYLINGWASIHLFLAAGLGIAVSMLLMAALMGLVFLSSGTGHDEAIQDHMPEDDDDR